MLRSIIRKITPLKFRIGIMNALRIITDRDFFQHKLGVDKSEAYIRNQNDVYSQIFDPWNSLSGPKYRILNLNYRAVFSILENNDLEICEIGCGLAVLTKMIKESGRNVIGIDSSPIAVDRAKTLNPDLNIEIGDCRTWKPSSPKQFDVVLLMEVYHRLSNQDKKLTLLNCARLLKKGGKIIVNYGNNDYLSGRKGSEYPDISKEIFEFFSPFQIIHRSAIDSDNQTENANTIYVGINDKF
jgi:SAM-dependent methyltransferase